MTPNYDSYYKKYANQTVNWLSSDTEQLYNYNLRSRRDELKCHGWIDSDITYRFNSFGFRCNEFTDAPTAMFLGCSFTVGIGLPLHSLWPEIVSDSLNLQCANLGIGAAAPNTAFRLCHGYIDMINPKIVVYLTPPPGRLEIIEDLPRIYGPWGQGTRRQPDLYKAWVSNEDNILFNEEKNLLGIRMLCADRNIKFINVSSSELPSSNSLARDLAHPGVECNSIFANHLLNLIE